MKLIKLSVFQAWEIGASPRMIRAHYYEFVFVDVRRFKRLIRRYAREYPDAWRYRTIRKIKR